MEPSTQITIIDTIYGEIHAEASDGAISVRGYDIPSADLINRGSERRAEIPIGTRRANSLSLSIAGRPWLLRPGSGSVTRRSYRIAVDSVDGPLLFTPSGPHSSRLVRGSNYRGDNELGQYTRSRDGTVTAAWSADASALGVTVRAVRPTPAEVAAGYTLALAFGTGAQLFLAVLVAAIDRIIPS